MEPTTIAGMFRKWDNAAGAIDLLSAAGFSADQLSLIVPKKVADEHRERSRTGVTGARSDAPAAMATHGGALVGGINTMLAGSRPLAASGVGTVHVTGPLSTRSAEAAAGKEVETRDSDSDVVGSLTYAGIPPGRAEVFAEGIKRGFILVAVESEDRSAEAINLLNQANTTDVEALRREWEREGWTGFARSA